MTVFSEQNPPAFPRDHRHVGHNGMSLRDWFAGQALAGYCAASQVIEKTYISALSADCYAMADAMLAERAK